MEPSQAGPSGAGPSDGELCRRVAAHDHEAFNLLLERHQARAHRLALSMLAGNEADARDVSQDAFIRLYEAAGRFDGRSQFSTWFYRIVVNLCIDHQRRNRWWRRLAPLAGPGDGPDALAVDPPAAAPEPDLQAINREELGRLRHALDKLSPSQRAAVVLQVLEGFSSREVAGVLKCSENTARVHVHRGLTQLKKMLRESETVRGRSRP